MDTPSTYRIYSTKTDNFPPDVFKWIKKNASPLISLKLMQVCKYFQHKKFPYNVINEVGKTDDGWKYYTHGDKQINDTQTLDIFPDKSLWITECLLLFNKIESFTLLLSKIAVCEAIQLYLYHQNLTMNEFKILTACGTLEDVNMTDTIIREANNDLVSLESILQCLPNVIDLFFEIIVPSFTSIQDTENISMPKMESLKAFLIPDTFNFDTFAAFMKSHPSIFCRLSYNPQVVLPKNYVQRLQQYVNIRGIKNSIKYPPPVIHFPGQSENDSSALDRLYRRYLQEKHYAFYGENDSD